MTAIAPAGGWQIDLLEVGSSIHPGGWVGPGFPEWMWSPMNALLLRRPGTTVLVDAGPGPLAPLWPFDGIRADLGAALAAVGCTPGDIDVVLLSHLDDDHIGGLVTGTWPDVTGTAMPRARVFAPLLAVVEARAAPADTPRRRVVDVLTAEGLLSTVVPGDEPVPGVRVLDAPGHRVGHVAIEVADPADPLLHLCDALHNRAHVAHPEWDRDADSEPEVALATRRSLLAALAASGTRAVASHVDGPHAFRIEEDDDGALRAVSVITEDEGGTG